MKHGPRSVRTARLMAACIAALAAALLPGCITDETPGGASPALPRGDADNGKVLIDRYGCGSCHEISGIADARGKVGPPLEDWSQRKMIAGRLPNNPPNLERWIRDPQGINPGVDMPNLGISVDESKDIAAYLLREGRN